MASITITTNFGEVLTSLGQSINTIFDKNYLLRPVAIETIPNLTKRIHQDGKASDGSQIGTYSSGYLALRSGNYKNAGKKNSGFFTKGQNATLSVKKKKLNAKRPSYNRGSDTKVIVSLTRQLENNWSVMETPKGYGIGFTNSFNADKLGWVEEAKKKIIRELTTQEIDYAFERINELITDALNK